jgi:hypothetical protein
MFIETHRLAELTPEEHGRSSSIDLMIHDIDVIFKCSKIKSENISASGVSVISDTPHCNARIEFENGCVANLT